MFRRVGLFGLLAAAVPLLCGCPGSSGGSGGSTNGGGAGGGTGSGPIRVGYYGDMTGDTSTFGTSTKEGIDLAVEEINRTPPLGRPLEIVAEDDQGKSDQAASVVTKLVTQDKVAAVLGEVASSNSMAAAPICQRYKVPMITPASTNVDVTRTGDYIFRVCFIDPFQGAVMAKYAFNTLKAKRAGLLTDVGSDYSKGLAAAFKETFTRLGGQIVSDASYAKGDNDFNAQLSRLKAGNPEVVFIPGYYTEVGTIARQAREQGIKVPLIGGDGWDSPKLFEAAGTALEGSAFSNHYSVENQDRRVQDFVQAYKRKYGGKVPDAMAALGYDATKILADSINRAKSTDGDALRTAIAGTSSFPGVTGDITIDPERNAKKSAVVLQVRGKSYKFVETVQP